MPSWLRMHRKSAVGVTARVVIMSSVLSWNVTVVIATFSPVIEAGNYSATNSIMR